MRRKFFSTESKTTYIFHWIIIYMLVIVFGFILSYVATYMSNKDTMSIIEYDYIYYQEHGEFNPNVIINGANNFVYDSNGTLIAKATSEHLSDQWFAYVNNITTKISGKTPYYNVAITYDLKNPVAIVAGYTTEDNGTFLFLRMQKTFYKTLSVIAFTAALLIVTVAIYIYQIIKIEERSNAMQRNYVDNISHELKSPIASVRALTETMYDGLIQDEEKKKQYYKIILHEIYGLENTISNMLELSKIQNNQMDCSKTALSASDVFSGIIEKYAALCDNRGMDFSIISPLDMEPHTLYTNKALASRIMDILLDNAVKFAGEKGSVHILVEEAPDLITITIKDNGSGINPTDQPYIFGRFYKGDKSHNEKGSGLGLSIAMEIANSLNEKLWLRSSGPEGTEFAFTIHKN